MARKDSPGMRSVPSPIPPSTAEKLFIRLHKPEFVCGETVYGMVYLWVSAPIPAQKLKISFHGYEECFWEQWEMETNPTDPKTPIRRKVERHSKKEILKVESELVHYTRGFPLGYFCYPFKYMLAQVMPGCFSCRDGLSKGLKWTGEVTYIIRAKVDIPGVNHDLWTDHLLRIRENPPENTTIPRSASTFHIQSCFCIPRGHVEIVAWLENNILHPGDKLNIHYTINNTSSVDVQAMLFKLIRGIRLNGASLLKNPIVEHSTSLAVSTQSKQLANKSSTNTGERRRKVIPQEETGLSAMTRNMWSNMEVLFILTDTGCRPGQKIDRVRSTILELENDMYLHPTTHASNIKCTYVLEVEMRAKWSANSLIILPLLILPKKDSTWSDWIAPNWAKKCKIDISGEYSFTKTELLELKGFPGMDIQPQSSLSAVSSAAKKNSITI